jgi:hypothetical protein
VQCMGENVQLSIMAKISRSVTSPGPNQRPVAP